MAQHDAGDNHGVDEGLLTVRDFFRYAVSRFNAADVVYGHGTTTAIDEAAFLILESLNLPIDNLDPFFDARLTHAERELLSERIHRRVTERLPAPYLTGSAYIQGFRFRTDPRAIIPRALIGELLFSEMLTDEGIGLLGEPDEIRNIADICTGGGSLAILAAMVFPYAEIDAVDLSTDALALAAENIADHGLGDRITLYSGDLFTPLEKRRYDLIITNPPYVSRAAVAELPPEYRHEPAMALDGGEDGFSLVRRLIRDAGRHLSDTGGLLCEIGTDRDLLEAEFPEIEFLWLDTEETEGEVFWLTADQLPGDDAG